VLHDPEGSHYKKVALKNRLGSVSGFPIGVVSGDVFQSAGRPGGLVARCLPSVSFSN
jgi:hypothetical protein